MFQRFISCFSNNNIRKTYKRELFDYQKNNVNWMIQQEFNVKKINLIRLINYLIIILFIILKVLIKN